MNKWRQKNSVRYRYNQTAFSYDERYFDEQQSKYKVALEGVKIDRGFIVLDVGCGTGLFFGHIAKKSSLIVGVDISKKLLLQANVRAKSCGNVCVVLCDADFLPFADNCFHLVFAFTVLQNMPNPVQTLCEFNRVSLPAGSMVVTALKRAIALDVFADMLDQAKLKTILLKDDKSLCCNIVVTIKT
ncbi:MAG: class I SAM-dependent methyltransferase [Crenarchaeota archaeon]|nr:class I SAM-dependent methyltransferase [Thermoproteota archaeon]